jgi:1-phosphofructokinase
MYREGSKLFEKRLMMNSAAYNFVWCEGSVRTNVKIFDQSTQTITEINEPGVQVSESDLKRMTELVSRHAENSDYLVLAGSLPPGCPSDYYRTLIQSVEGLGCRCVLDADGEALKYGLEAMPFMIKPNRYELEKMIGHELKTLPEIKAAALKYIDMGVSIVAVSLGGEVALITDGDETLYAPVLNIDVRSTVGAGDSMVAGLVCGCMGECTLEETFRMGVACATARCVTEGHKVVDKTIYKALLDMVCIERI